MNVPGSTVPGQNGMATANTFRCIALPSGGLGPLPKRTFAYVPTAYPDGYANIVSNILYISGFHLTGSVLNATAATNQPHEFHIAWDYFSNAGGVTRRRYRAERHRMFEATPTIDTLKSLNSSVASPSTTTRGTFYADCRFYSQAAPPPPAFTGNATPCVAWAWYEEGGGAGLLNVCTVFPDPTGSISTNTIRDFFAANDQPMDGLVGHQGRVVFFRQNGISHGVNGSWSSNEQVMWTNINAVQIVQTTTTPSSFSQELMTGYAAFLPVSIRELFLVKMKGGGISVQGDLDSNPIVQRLPGVISSYGGKQMVTSYSPVGVVYGVVNGPVYAYAGGDSSINLAPQLEDAFWQIPTLSQWVNYAGCFDNFQDWVLVPNNWLYDTTGQSWWRVEDPSLLNIFNWQSAVIQGTFYGTQDRVTANGATVVYGWDRFTPASNYRWESQPLRQTMDRVVHVREIVLVSQGPGTITVTLKGLGGTTQAESFVVLGTAQPVMTKKRTSLQADHIQVQIDSDNGSGPAPIVYSVELFFDERQHVGPS